ncbi:MAG: serine/threonine-protein kinase, partial [Planctomycetota bacterium]
MVEATKPLTRLGPYRLLETLGAGAMGTVYLAQDEEEDRRVALKALHPHLLERKGLFKRFQREALAGERVKHPNVVRTLDCGLQMDGETPYCLLVMECVEGRTLRTLLKELETVPEALLREIARQVAAGLEAIHEAGIVHRDLKPENILITKEHQVRIMDLGVARLTEVSTALTKEGQFAGSLLYAAPEQFRGAKVGPEADLYALGVTLFELAAGANPFRHDDAAAVMAAHLETVPPRLDRRSEDTSPFLAEVVATLLQKNAPERFGSAAFLKEILDQGEHSAWWAQCERVVLQDKSHVPKIPVRRETNVYGRETELELLRRSWEGAKKGDGNSVLVEGEAGIGKTRLVDLFLDGLADDDVHVLYGSYPPTGGMGGVSDAILAHFGTEALEEALRPYLTETLSLAAPLAAVLNHETPPPDAPSLAGDVLHAVCVHLMRALAAEKPLLWIVEDLHFADADSRKLLLSLARAVEGHSVLLLTTARPELPEEELAHCRRLENFRQVVLGRLSAREVILLLQDAFGSEALAEKLGGKIALKSDGIPFFVFEMIRGLKEGQFITELPDGSYVESRVIEKIDVPSAVKDLIEVRLRGLNKEERAILDVGAVQGFEFDPDLIARVREMKRISVLETLGHLDRRTGAVRSEGNIFRFDHHQFQEVLYSGISQRLRTEYHALLAEAFAAREGVEVPDAGVPGATAYFLAWHGLQGHEPRKSIPFLNSALDHLEKSHRNQDAIELAERALAVPKLLEGNKRVGVLLAKATRHDLRGERVVERAALNEALVLADLGEDAALRAKVRNSLGHHLTQTSEYVAARECLERALDLAREAEDRKAEGAVMGNLGNVLTGEGRWEEAYAQFEKRLAVAREIADVDGEAGATINMGDCRIWQSRHNEACGLLERGLALARQCGNRRLESSATAALGNVFWLQGRYEEARAQYEKFLALSREIGDRGGEAGATGNLGLVLLNQGRDEEARAQ